MAPQREDSAGYIAAGVVSFVVLSLLSIGCVLLWKRRRLALQYQEDSSSSSIAMTHGVNPAWNSSPNGSGSPQQQQQQQQQHQQQHQQQRTSHTRPSGSGANPMLSRSLSLRAPQGAPQLPTISDMCPTLVPFSGASRSFVPFAAMWSAADLETGQQQQQQQQQEQEQHQQEEQEQQRPRPSVVDDIPSEEPSR